MSGTGSDHRPGEVAVEEIPASLTHDLRRRVLRVGTPSDSVDWEGDDDASTLHLGIFVRPTDRDDEQRLRAISTWLARPSPDLTDLTDLTGQHDGTRRADTSHRGVQLRGMATDPSARGAGYGSLLLTTGLGRARDSGFDHVWANARSAVLDFYVRHGFAIVSDEFDSIDTGIAHRRILLRFSRAS